MSKQKIELALNLADLEKMKDIFDYCQVSAERIAALTPTIQQFHTGAVPGELAAFSEEPGIYADLREAQWLLNDGNHIANMMGLHWIKAIIKARCHAEGVPIAFNGKEEKELASKQNVGPVENKVEIRLDPAFPKSVFACDDKGKGAFLPASEVNISFESPSPELEEYIKGVSKGLDPAPAMGKLVDMPIGSTKLNADPTNQQAEAWRKICALLDELRPGWIDADIKGVESALKTITTMAEKADFAEVKPDLYLTGFQWKDSQGAWQFALGPAGSAWYESQGFKTRFVYVTEKD